jgi:hypothetical protein
MGVYVQTK